MSAPANLPPHAESARRVCARLHQACRDIRLYPADHPTVRGTMERLMETLIAHLEGYGPMMLAVDEAALFCEGEEVYAQESTRGNLAFILFRDGIRSLTFHYGLEEHEAQALVDCMSRADNVLDEDEDLATVLWEQDLIHIEYEIVDPFLEGKGRGDDPVDQLRDTVMRRLSELTSVGAPGLEEPGEGGGMGQTDGSGGYEEDRDDTIDPDSVTLTQEELQQSELEFATPPDPLDDFTVVLLEIAGDPASTPEEDEKVQNALVLAMQKYLGEMRLDGLELVISRLDLLEQQGRRPEGFADALLCRAATPERLSRLVEKATPGSSEQMERIDAFLRRMRTCAFPALLEILATSDDRGVRKLVLDLLRTTGGIPLEHLRPLVDDPRWYVVRNAVQLVADSGDPELAEHLERLMRHPDERVRREVMRSIDTLNDRRSLPLLVKALQDEDSSVRILAVRSLGRLGTGAQFPAVHAQVESRDFEARSNEELEAFLQAFALLGGERAVKTLDRYWRRRVFGTRPQPLRLAAVQALALISNAAASHSLNDAVQSSEATIQRTAARAISEAQAKVRGVRS